MKKIFSLMLAALFLFSCAATALADDEFDGVILPSAEEYLNVPPCTGFSTQDNYYAYRYKDCGVEYEDDGDNDIWALFEQYVKDLVSTGYFKVAHHDSNRNSTIWCLTYTGPDKYLKETFSTKRSLDDIYAIEVSSLFGDASVYYSVDIQTTNLQETMQRLGYAPPSGDGDCTICDGDGKCNKCGGSGYIYKLVLRNGKHENIHTTCDAQLCRYGSCTACGGDGDR